MNKNKLPVNLLTTAIVSILASGGLSAESLKSTQQQALPAIFELSDINGSNGFTILGEDASYFSGRSVSNLGDVNNDGIDDMIIGANGANPEDIDSGAAYVVFGDSSGFSSPFRLSSINGSNGFAIYGEAAGDYTGHSTSNAGDINGDGIDDLVLGAIYANSNGTYSGAAFVVFGNSTGFSSTLQLTSLNGSNGFKIKGQMAYDYMGKSVSDAGDINGDGIDDLIVGAFRNDNNDSDSGAAYVIFGKTTGFSSPMEMSILNGSNGFKIKGEQFEDELGHKASSAGDINGDGIADVIISATSADPNGDSRAGSSYLIFGKTTGFSSILESSSLNGSNGFKINGEVAHDFSGTALNHAGDFNGDGVSDLIIGAHNQGPNGSTSGASYMVFGKKIPFSSPLNLSDLNGSNGFKLNGPTISDFTGFSVSNAGDVNNDGVSDIMIGAHGDDTNGSSAGAVYVVYGNDHIFSNGFD